MISLIAAIGKNRELGRGGKLLFQIPEDMKFFRETTMGHKVVMGRKTWESLSGKLEGRENIVISRREVAGADRSVAQLSQLINELSGAQEEVFVIGGGMVYYEMIPYADKLYLTEVDEAVADADTFFPDFERADYRREILQTGEQNGHKYTISCYTRIKKEEKNG